MIERLSRHPAQKTDSHNYADTIPSLWLTFNNVATVQLYGSISLIPSILRKQDIAGEQSKNSSVASYSVFLDKVASGRMS